jgi:hypothetical protein
MNEETHVQAQDDNGWSWVVYELQTAFGEISSGLEKLQAVLQQLAGGDQAPAAHSQEEWWKTPVDANDMRYEPGYLDSLTSSQTTGRGQVSSGGAPEPVPGQEAEEPQGSPTWSVSLQAAFEDKLSEQTMTWGGREPSFQPQNRSTWQPRADAAAESMWEPKHDVGPWERRGRAEPPPPWIQHAESEEASLSAAAPPEPPPAWPPASLDTQSDWQSAVSNADEPDTSVRDEVRRMVEQAKAEMASGAARLSDEDASGAAPVDHRSALGQQGGEETGWPNSRRQEGYSARGSWAQMPMETSAGWEPEQAASASDGIGAWDRGVPPARSHGGPTEPPRMPEFSGPDIESVRVERAERGRIDERSLEEKLASIAPQIMIDDPSGRVELVRVYQALARLGRASEANLANYTPHSVTLILESGAPPSNAELAAAVEEAFGRACDVTIDGAGRIVVRLLDYNARVA